jgi:anthranilate synthase/aminodeoxychorismate synthase-like glutamine amidotransferase
VILVIDNYDSFTYNLVQLLGKLTTDIVVKRNDELQVEEIGGLQPERILISPGPGRPEDAGITVETIRRYGGAIPILGVCLGHQAIGLAFGGSIVHAPTLMHGRTSRISHENDPLFSGVSNPFTATRYHSLVIGEEGFPTTLMITARSDDGVIMGVRHRQLPVVGVQFHPESILTDEGEKILNNWLRVQQ